MPAPSRLMTRAEANALPPGLIAHINADKVQLIGAHHPVSWLTLALGLGARIVVRGSRIFWPHLPDDLSLDASELALLAHELTHVWQYDTGMTLWRYLKRERGVYGYRPDPRRRFEDYGYEQQAALVEDWVRLKSGLAPRYARSPVDTAALEAIIPFA